MSADGVVSSVKWKRPNTASEIDPTMTLEHLLRSCGINAIDYLKMDCEGSEWEIVLESPDTLLHAIGRIEMEYHCYPGSPPLQAMVDRLKATGSIRSACTAMVRLGSLWQGARAASQPCVGRNEAWHGRPATRVSGPPKGKLYRSSPARLLCRQRRSW